MPTVIDRRRVQELVQRGAQLVEVLAPKEYEADWVFTKLIEALPGHRDVTQLFSTQPRPRW